VNLASGQSATVTVTITANSGLADKSMYGGYIVFTPPSGAVDALRVPYAGFKGDYQSIQALAPTANNFPRLGRSLGGGNFGLESAGATFTMGTDVPYVLVHLDHAVRTLRAEIYDSSNKAWHRAFNLEYVGRNQTATGFFALAFDGTTVNGTKTNVVPDGTYYIKLTAVKALGTEAAGEVETWTSPLFVIDRP
jgi:hypothetical protein